jgi:phosphoglucosamine mutase
VRVTDKHAWRDNAAIQAALAAAEERLGDTGRVLVRESGTEQLIRVMAEGPDEKLLRQLIGDIVRVVEAELGV